jgi:hypothetical protein
MAQIETFRAFLLICFRAGYGCNPSKMILFIPFLSRLNVEIRP